MLRNQQYPKGIWQLYFLFYALSIENHLTTNPPRSFSFSKSIGRWFSRSEAQLLLLLLLASFPLYYELGRNPVQLWDESRVAVNAVEMAQNGHWLTPHFAGTPDHWNTKPPLLIWLEALSFKTFGFSTWALRLPTLLSTLGTVVLLFWFAAKVLHRPVAGLFGGVILVTCAGYVRLHVARTGEYDALLTFWQVVIWVSFFRYLEADNRFSIYWLTLGLIAAVLTKGPAGLISLPGLVMYAGVRGRSRWLLRQSSAYVAAGIVVVVVAGYFLIREAVDPGYWTAVQYNDLGGRFLTEHGGQHPWNYYLLNLKNQFFTLWLWAVIPALLAGLLQPTGIVRRAVWLLTSFVVGWLVVISIAQSGLEWYDAPIYPALALLVGIGLSILCEDLMGLYLPRFSWRIGLMVKGALVVGVAFIPYYTIVNQLISERKSDYGLGPDSYLGRYLTKLVHDQPQIDKLTLLSRGGYSPILMY